MARYSLFVAALVVSAAACRHEDEDSRVPLRLSRTADTSRVTAPMKDGDLRITSVDGGVDLALIGDSISGGLSRQTLDKVRHDIDTSAVRGSGLGASIEKMVKGTVQSALNTRVVFALTDVKDVRYDGQKLVFDWNGKAPGSFSKVKVNDNKDVLESFSSDDAQRFVIAVRARKRALGRQM